MDVKLSPCHWDRDDAGIKEREGCTGGSGYAFTPQQRRLQTGGAMES